MSDDRFLQRTRRTTIALALWIGGWLAVSGGFQYLCGLLSGVVFGLFSLWSLERLSDGLRPPEDVSPAGPEHIQKACRRFVLTSLGRYLLLGVGLFLLFSPPRVSIGAFLLGVSMPLWVMVLKAVGQMIRSTAKRSVRS
ncbi:MAG: hypothetical protein ACUVTZ_13235 [Armatimonadota bacterium]